MEEEVVPGVVDKECSLIDFEVAAGGTSIGVVAEEVTETISVEKPVIAELEAE